MKRLIRNILPALGFLSLSAYAQTNTAISATPRFQQSGRLDYVALGASFRTDNGNSGSVCTIKTGDSTTATGSARNGNNEVVANNATLLGSNRSAAQVVPADSTIKAAYLYWVASQNDGTAANADNQVTLTVGGVASTVTASRVWTGTNSNGGSMGAFADVTSLMPTVTAANSTVRMDGLSIQINGSQCRSATVHGAWALYVVYEHPGLSSRLISFYDGLEYIGGSAGIDSKSITASGFSVPNASSLDRVSKVSVMVADGDYDATGDSLALKSNLNSAATVQSSTGRTSSNFFVGLVSNQSEDGTVTQQTGSTNTSVSATGGLDIATLLAPTSVIPAGTSTITATIDSASGELLIAHSLVLMANTSNANVRIVKALEGAATTYRVGDSLKYLLTVDNSQGTYEALNVVTTDTLPKGLTYGSTEISYDGGSTWAALSGVTSSVNASTGVTSITLPAIRRLDNDGKVWGGTNAIASQLGSQNVRYRLTVTANGDVLGSLNNTVSVTTGSAESITSDNTSSAAVTIVTPYDLSVSKTNGQTSVVTNTGTTYTLRVTNSGAASVTGAVLRDPAATGMTVTGVTCSVVSGNICTAAPTTAQLQAGVTLPTLATGAFYEVQVTANVTAAAGSSVTNTATVALPSGLTDATPGDNTASDTDSVTAASAPPASNPTSYPASCDVIDWATSAVSSGSNQTSLGNVTRTFTSAGGRSIGLNLTSASGAGNGIMGYSATFSNYGSWYEVRAVSQSLQPNISQAFLTRAGGSGNSNNTIVITFPTPVINVRLGLTDLDAVGGSGTGGDWARVQAGYAGQTFNPDLLIGGGHALAVQAYTGIPSGSGAAMTVTVPGVGNSQMKAASTATTYNTLMGVDTSYGEQVSGVNRQGQGVAYFKGPLTSLTITTGSQKGGAGQAIALSNIDFCPPSVAVDKAAGSPVRQADFSYDIPYTLTYRNTSMNVGYHPDATVRDAVFSPSIATPSGADPWARQQPQLTDAALDQIRANTNVETAILRGTPTLSSTLNTVNLDATDLNSAFSGTAANPSLLLANTDGRVDPGGSFAVTFTANVKLKNTVTTAQTVNNQATATASLFTGSLSATSTTVASTLTPGAALSVTKVADQALIRYPLASGTTRLRYTITVTNTSGVTATGVQVTDTLPANLPYADTESGNTPPTTRSGQTLTWNLGMLAPNASSAVVVYVDVPAASSLEAAAGQAQSAIVNTASVQAGNAPSASGSVPVNTLYTRLFKQVRNLGPQGSLTPAWASAATGLPGDVLEYCINVANLGSTSLSNYRVSDVVPASTLLVAGSVSLRQGVMDAPGAAVAGVTVSETATTDAVGRPTTLLQTSALTLAPGAQVVLCFRAAIK